MEEAPLPDHSACRTACFAVLALIVVVAVACLGIVSLRHGRSATVTVVSRTQP